MAAMMTISFLVNLGVLALVIPSLWTGNAGMTAAFGPETTARQILLCVYAAIWLASAVGLALLGIDRLDAAVSLAIGLFAIQVIYKGLTVVTIGLASPVVATNVPIAVLHAATLAVIFTRS